MTTAIAAPADACPAVCGRPVKPGYVTCAPCWIQVPEQLRRAVVHEWHAWQRNPDDTGQRARYHDALEQAVASIAVPRQRTRP